MASVYGDIRSELIDLLGEEEVCENPDVLTSYSYSLAANSIGNPQFMVTPKDGEEVGSLVELANRLDINLVPVSSGHPGVHGATVPAGDGVIVDLSGMKRIMRLDRRNKVALIEPGVTFAHLNKEAAKHGLKAMMPLHPRDNKSVLASYLDREPNLIPKYHWDMTDPMLCVEVIFGTGDIFRTGSAAGPGSLEQQWKAGQAQKNPMGPGQADLIRVIQGSQGTMGIVTWASVKLEVLPLIRRAFLVVADNLEELIEFSYRCLRRRVGDEFLILNDLNLASLLAEEAVGIESQREKLINWNLLICVSGYEFFPGWRVDMQEKSLRQIAGECGLSIKRKDKGASEEKLLEILDGPCSGNYWKLRYRGGFRELFFLTTLDLAPRVVSLACEEFRKAGDSDMEVGFYIQPIQHGRACHVELNFFLDPANGERLRVIEGMISGIVDRLMDEGAFFSRPYGSWMEPAYARCPDTVNALAKIKSIFDPNNVLNRGRLCF